MNALSNSGGFFPRTVFILARVVVKLSYLCMPHGPSGCVHWGMSRHDTYRENVCTGVSTDTLRILKLTKQLRHVNTTFPDAVTGWHNLLPRLEGECGGWKGQFTSPQPTDCKNQAHRKKSVEKKGIQNAGHCGVWQNCTGSVSSYICCTVLCPFYPSVALVSLHSDTQAHKHTIWRKRSPQTVHRHGAVLLLTDDRQSLWLFRVWTENMTYPLKVVWQLFTVWVDSWLFAALAVVWLFTVLFEGWDSTLWAEGSFSSLGRRVVFHSLGWKACYS